MIRTISIFLLLTLNISLAFAAYNVTLAKEFAYASALIKCHPNQIQAWNCGQACTNLTGYKPYYSQEFNASYGESFAFAMIYNPSIKRFVTSYRGTVGTLELIYEMIEGDPVAYKLSNITGALVDDYFYNHYVTFLRPLVIPQLKNAAQEFPDYQFAFTGHSLGAAFTTHTAFDAVSQGIIKREQAIMYNFGSPRVGNYYFAQAVQEAVPEIYRLTHWRDIVPHVPPCYNDAVGNCMINSTSKFGKPLPGVWAAYHVAQEIFYNEDFSEVIECNGGEELHCSNQFSLIQTTKADHDFYVNVSIACTPNSYEESEASMLFLQKLENLVL